MSVKRVDPKEAAKLVEDGWTYVDVRSVPEFDGGHPTGAYNLPLLHQGPTGARTPNPDFAPAFARAFPDRDQQIVMGCRSGQRSFKAATMLSSMGYSNLVDMRGGYSGDKDTTGWADESLATATSPESGRSWDELK